MPETPSNSRHKTASSAQCLSIWPPVGPKARNVDHSTSSLRNQSHTLPALPRRCTLWTGGNPLWSLSELGFVPHLAWSSRVGPFPGSRRPQPPISVFWLCSVLLAKWPVSRRDCCHVSCSPARRRRFPQACLRFATSKSFMFNGQPVKNASILADWLRSGCLPPAPSTPPSITACKPRPSTTTQAGASPFGVVSDAAETAGCLRSPTPVPPAAVPSRNSGTYTKAPESPDPRTIHVTHLARKAF
jgi:hypothetical protein